MQTRKMRNFIRRHQRWGGVVLILVVLVIFTVTDEIVDWMRGGSQQAADPEALVGSFSVLPLARVNVTAQQFEAARRECDIALSFLTQQPLGRVRDGDVWTYMLLREAAKREGVVATTDEVNRLLKARIQPMYFDDAQIYREFIGTNYRASAAEFEAAIRAFLTAQRVRDVYRESFLIAPPAPREALVKRYANQPIEYARVTPAVLDAELFVKAAGEELKAENDPDKKLNEFFDKDPAVKSARSKFRHPRRYQFEVMYTVHKNLTEESYQRVERVFAKAYPDLDVDKLEPTVKDLRDFFGIYRDRLLEESGTSWDKVKEEVEKAREEEEAKDAAKDEDDGKKEGDEKKEGDDEKAGDEEKEGDEPKVRQPGEDDEPATDTSPDLRQLLLRRGLAVVQEKVERELKVRGMYQWFRDQAGKDESKSLKELFALLKQHDDPSNPVCSEVPGEGIIVFRYFEALTGDEIEEIEDSGVRFTHNYRARITGIGDADLPKVARRADVLGDAGHGRQITRLMEVKRDRRKTFEELTPGEKEDLREEYYLPEMARQRAKDRLDELRKKCVDGEIDAADFPKAAREIGCRVHENEWIEASYDEMAEPVKELYWADEYVHMRDRHFLHRNLAQVLGRDRIEKKLKAGSYLDVQIDADPDAEETGAAFLVLLLERRKPSAETMPMSELASFLVSERRDRLNEETQRWSTKIEQIFRDFEFEFYDEMKRRIDEELRRRRQAAARR